MATDFQRRWENRRAGRSVADQSRNSYYGLPAIHRAHWKWEIVVYFFIGGISGASYLIAAITRWLGGKEGRPITRVGRYLSFATLLPSPILLILDLKKPERFHHMLRIFKLRSPMSVGTWGLTFFGAFSAISAFIQAAEDGLFRWLPPVQKLLLVLPARLIGAVGAFFGFFVAGYTGVLLAVTAVPLWAKNHLLLGPLFIASALSNATAAITLILALTRSAGEKTLKRLERLDMFVLAAEFGLMLVMRKNSGSVISRPLEAGTKGKLYKWGVQGLGMALPFALQAKSVFFGSKRPRLVAAIASLLVLIGGAIYRYVIVYGGHDSADDPEATFEYARDPERAAAYADPLFQETKPPARDDQAPPPASERQVGA